MFKVNSLFLIATLMIQTQCCQGQIKDRDYWIERYLSVSYPLQQIKVTSPFGNRKDPFTGKLAYHGGLDLKAKNEFVLSMFDGYVEQIGEDGRSGRFVILRHGDYQVSYCHLSKVLATEGEEVLAGDIVGVTGNTGRSTGEHLHITCRYKGDKHDPYLLLQSIQRIRKQCSDALEQEGLSDSSRVAFIEKYAPAAMGYLKANGDKVKWRFWITIISALRQIQNGLPMVCPITYMTTTSPMRSFASFPMQPKAWNIIRRFF